MPGLTVYSVSCHTLKILLFFSLAIEGISFASAFSDNAAALSGQKSSLGALNLRNAQNWMSSPAGRDKLRKCLPTSEIPFRDKNLTAAELELLPSICWRVDLETERNQLQSGARGVPAGVKCKVTKW